MLQRTTVTAVLTAALLALAPTLASVNDARALTASQLLEVLIAADVVPEDNVEQARQLVAQRSGPTLSPIQQNLAMGDRGPAVKRLQQALNHYTDVQVAASGPGSAGNETTYFGPQTRRAVIRFQERHAAEILAPVNVTDGTGYVGPSTRVKLNELIRDTQTSRTANEAADEGDDEASSEQEREEEEVQEGDSAQNEQRESDETSSERDEEEQAAADEQPEDEQSESEQLSPSALTDGNMLSGDGDGEFYVSGISTYQGPIGTEITLRGNGFAEEENTVHLGDMTLDAVPATGSGTALTFTVPDDAPIGKHSVWVSNDDGESNKSFFFVVTEEEATRPVVESISPTEGLYGTEVTIHGSGFTADGNDIHASYAIIEDLPSPDGETITFQVMPEPDIEHADKLQVGEDISEIDQSIPFWFRVVNENGTSRGSAKFILNL
jgi:peptidoglycan hydrolase-like protein with peptidoglycan-binding domain